jgi:hypothetical protein
VIHPLVETPHAKAVGLTTFENQTIENLSMDMLDGNSRARYKYTADTAHGLRSPLHGLGIDGLDPLAQVNRE